jgi:hypothetical protein
MSVGKEEEKINAYNEEDSQLLVSLLNEYAEKLEVSCGRIENLITSKDRRYAYVFTLVCLIIVAGGLIGILETNYHLNIFLVINAPAFSNAVLTPILTVTFIAMLALIVAYGIEIVNISLKIDVLIRDAKILAKRLEKVVQIVSQIQEHAVERVSRRVEMDLRLADAEITLGHYESISRRRKGFKFFGRSLMPLSRSATS